MSTERINALDIDHRELFTAIYGLSSLSEVYITQDLRVHNLREILYLYLKQEGYTTVFYDDKAFSYEEQPLLEFFGFTARRDNNANGTETPGVKKDFFKGKGPMSRSRNLNRVSGNQAPTSDTSHTHHDAIRTETFGNQRRYMVLQEEGFLKNVFSYAKQKPSSKLAVVFVSPTTLHLDDRQRDTYINLWNELLENFKRNRLAIRIITIYCYPSAEIFAKSLDNGDDAFFLQSPFKENILNDIGGDEDSAKRATFGKGKTVFFLQSPGRDEIANMLNRRRLMTNEGLPHLFTRIKWDHIVLRLWQGVQVNPKDSKGQPLSLISEYMDCEQLDRIIENMDTVKAIDRLESLQGIDGIKQQFALYRQALANHRAGIGGGRFRPHMALMGSPGTGKSTVARLFGDILREDGLLPKGHFVKVSTDELVGEFVGSTRPKTRAVCERARGGVLFIDEAYGLMSGSNTHGDIDYGKEAIEVLIQFMEDNDDSLVILAGYTDEINQLIDEGNKGFRRRFNKLGFFHFEDYKPQVLFNIASKMFAVPTTDDFMKALKGIIRYKYAYRNKKFGNVGDMENLVNLIESHYRSLDTTEPLNVQHLPDDLRLLVDDSVLDPKVLLADLDNIIGQDGVKELVRTLFKKVVADRIKLRTIDDFTPKMPKLNFLFTGNPGTGKTTIARIIGNVLRKLGIFPTSSGNIVTEIAGNDLLRAAPEDVKKLFEDNIGRILFIDEAYQLRDNPRVVADIVANLELTDYKNKLSVILAGYPDDMRALMNVNAGMTRRFQEIQFSDYSNEELYEILLRMVEAAPNTVMDADTCREAGLLFFASQTRDRNFGNAGVAENLLHMLADSRDSRFVDATPDLQANQDFAERILPEDFPGVTGTPDAAHHDTPTSPQASAVHFDGIIDCSQEDVSRIVTTGNDIYTSTGLIESERGTGTAFIISVNNRYIMTASHVVEGCTRFSFMLNMPNGLMKTEAHLLWNNYDHDFALLQVDSLPSEATYFVFDTVTPREPATELSIAAFPMGTQVSSRALLTKGAISNYETGVTIRNEHGDTRTFNAIRTEAQATHGSSGGPVMLASNMRIVGVLHGGMNDHGFFMNVASDITQLFNDNTINIIR